MTSVMNLFFFYGISGFGNNPSSSASSALAAALAAIILWNANTIDIVPRTNPNTPQPIASARPVRDLTFSY